MAINDPCWLHAPDLAVPQRESEGEGSLGRGIQPPPPILSALGSARPRAEGKSDSVMPLAKCDAQKSERGEACMFNKKHWKRKEDGGEAVRPSTLGNPLEASRFPEEQSPVNQEGGGKQSLPPRARPGSPVLARATELHLSRPRTQRSGGSGTWQRLSGAPGPVCGFPQTGSGR